LNIVDNADSVGGFELSGARQSLDELFSLARRYRSSAAYYELIRFISRFRSYAPFNAMLVHIQKPGAVYVAPPHRWMADHRRRIRAEAQPLVILQPMGPVMFVFDVSDTAPEGDAPALPLEIDRPFDVGFRSLGTELELTVENAKRDGVEVVERNDGSQRAGSIQFVEPGGHVSFRVKHRPAIEYCDIPLMYKLILNSNHCVETKYATLVHELAHLYCGHLGTPNKRWWPERSLVSDKIKEFEAESISYLVCKRAGLDSPSERYLANYLEANPDGDVPPVSLECVVKCAGLIETMGHRQMKPRTKE
jgi:hypothetical protein